MHSKGLFITGTDTGVGKTEISLALMHLLQNQGYRVVGMKPVAAGGNPNADAVRLQQAGSVILPYAHVNPYALLPATAPHIAAANTGVRIRAAVIRSAFMTLTAFADQVIVEGIGGWRVPLGTHLEVADLPGLLGLPVILVVGLRLGCLNHALLTAESLQHQGCEFAGWIANHIDPNMAEVAANQEALLTRLHAPCLGYIPYCKTPPLNLLRLNLAPLKKWMGN